MSRKQVINEEEDNPPLVVRGVFMIMSVCLYAGGFVVALIFAITDLTKTKKEKRRETVLRQ